VVTPAMNSVRRDGGEASTADIDWTNDVRDVRADLSLTANPIC
jgi:hypothetical protein